MITRFAPSPTGRLHLGHALSAVTAHDRARAAAGAFRLRIEDIDPARCRPEFARAIFDDLAWLGIGWDGPAVVQSMRLGAYAAALDRMIAAGLAYPCFCSRADIAREVAGSLSAPHGADGPLYPGTCRALPRRAAIARAATDPHSWRLDVAAAIRLTGPLAWHDERAGTVAADPVALGDIIVKGRDRPASYHLAVVVDDAEAGITLVVRGMDLFASTHVQRILQAVLGLPTPTYHHHRLIAGADGRRLAKRDAAAGIDRLRAAGVEGPALAESLRHGALPIGFGWATA
ncbi:MAG: glutamyl-tRNA synthetase [Sphingomonas bacterium]|nr:tRNA glutamyl-Q(34) synthetase GluQRS [Sphingomonas bacterium]MDB5688152.1 glutamyl-tRNA synthetase [Sphingomonas bacterium]